GVIDVETLAPVAAEGTESANHPALPEEGEKIAARVVRVAGDLGDGVDSVHRAVDAAERAEIVHRYVVVEEAVIIEVRVLGDADDLAEAANIVGYTGRAAECTEIGDGVCLRD